MLIFPIIVAASCGHFVFTTVILTSSSSHHTEVRTQWREREQDPLSLILPRSAEALLSSQQQPFALDSGRPGFLSSQVLPLG